MDIPKPPIMPASEAPAPIPQAGPRPLSAVKWGIVIAGAGALGAIALLIALALFLYTQLVREAGRAKPSAGWIILTKQVELHDMETVNHNHDGATEPTVMEGVECHSLLRYPGRPELYAYFKIDPARKHDGTNTAVIEVEYFDADAGGHFRLDYDSYDDSNRSQGAYTQSRERVNLKRTQRWRKARFLLDDARFAGRQNDQADFRVTVVGARFYLRSVRVTPE